MKKLPITLYPSKVKTMLLLLICITFVILAVMMILDGKMMGWFCAIFFGLGVIVFTIQLIPNSAYLKISEEGIETKSLFKKSNILPWSVIKEFNTGYVGVNKMVMLNFNENYKKQKIGREIAKSISGFDGALPDNYGMTCKDLAELLNFYKEKHS